MLHTHLKYALTWRGTHITHSRARTLRVALHESRKSRGAVGCSLAPFARACLRLCGICPCLSALVWKMPVPVCTSVVFARA